MKKSKLQDEPRHLVAAFSLFVGISGANAVGGIVQFGFFGLCLCVLVLQRHRVPVGLLGSVVLCGLIAMLTSMRSDPGFGPLLRFVRPFIEGYLLAILLYKFCHIRNLESLLTMLAGYVAIEIACASLMVAIPDLRSVLIDQWYSDDSYDGQAFRTALLFRGFGVSRHHMFGMPLALGTISVLLLVGSSLERSSLRRWMLTSAALSSILLIIPNARIGLVPVMVCYALGISFFFRLCYLRQLTLLLSVGLPLMLLLVRLHLGELGEVLVDWMFEGLSQFIDPSQASGATTVSDLGGMIILPTEPLTWLIGEGRICQPGEGCYADIGWIRLFQEGGLVLAIAIATLYFGIIIKIITGLRRFGMNQPLYSSRSSRDLLLWVFFITFIAATIKGEAYAPNDYSRLLMALAVLLHQNPVYRIPSTRTVKRIAAPKLLQTLYS